jgi:hypothetical protein
MKKLAMALALTVMMAVLASCGFIGKKGMRITLNGVEYGKVSELALGALAIERNLPVPSELRGAVRKVRSKPELYENLKKGMKAWVARGYSPFLSAYILEAECLGLNTSPDFLPCEPIKFMNSGNNWRDSREKSLACVIEKAGGLSARSVQPKRDSLRWVN